MRNLVYVVALFLACAFCMAAFTTWLQHSILGFAGAPGWTYYVAGAFSAQASLKFALNVTHEVYTKCLR